MYEGSRFHFFDCPDQDSDGRGPPLPPGCRILGIAPSHGRITLDGYFPSTWDRPGGTPWVDGYADSVWKGAAGHSHGQLEPDGLVAEMRGLEEALTGTLGDRGVINPRGGRRGGSVAHGEHLAVHLDNGAQVLFHAGETETPTFRETRTEVRATVRVRTPHGLALGDIEHRYLDAVRELVVFCTRQPSYIQRLTMSSPTWEDEVQVLRQPWPLSRRPLGRIRHLALNLGRINEPRERVKRWFALREDVGAVWSLFFATLGQEEGSLENRFLNLMAFTEGYHRARRDHPPLDKQQEKSARTAVLAALDREDRRARDVFVRSLSHANSQTQRDRLIELAAQARDLLTWDFDPLERCRSMVDTRNWMTHWGSRTRHVADDPASLSRFSRELELILYVAILSDLELDASEIAECVRKGRLREGLA